MTMMMMMVMTAIIIISTLFTVGFNLVKWTKKYLITTPQWASKGNESTKYLKGNVALCPAGLQYSTYISSKLPKNYTWRRKGSVFLQSFLKLFSGKAFLNLSKKERRLPRDKIEFILWWVECAGGRCNVFSFLKSYGKKVILK